MGDGGYGWVTLEGGYGEEIGLLWWDVECGVNAVVARGTW